MKKEILFVEFLGLPGAGKTTIGKKVAKELEYAGYKTYSLDCLIKQRKQMPGFIRGFYLLLFILMNLRLAVSILKFALFFKPLNSSSIRYAYNAVRTIFKIEQAKKNAFLEKCPVIIFDQGLLQDLWSVGVTGKPSNIDSITAYLKEMLELLYNKIQFSVVFFDVKPEIAAQRIHSRRSRKYRFEKMDPAPAEAIIKTKTAYLSLIFKSAAGVKNCKTLALDNNTEDTETQVEEVCRFIKNDLKNVFGRKFSDHSGSSLKRI